jgi:hypothetical protein
MRKLKFLVDIKQKCEELQNSYKKYFPTVLTNRYDVLVYLDKSNANAIHPFHMPAESGEVKEDLPETFPTGL